MIVEPNRSAEPGKYDSHAFDVQKHGFVTAGDQAGGSHNPSRLVVPVQEGACLEATMVSEIHVTGEVVTDANNSLTSDRVIGRTGMSGANNSRPLLEVRTMSIHALVQIEETCQALTNHACYRIDNTAVSGLPDHGLNINEIAAYLGRRSTPAASRDAVWRYVIDQANGADQNWPLIAIRLAMPGVRRAITRAQNILPEFDRGELETEAVYAFIEALRTIQTSQTNLCSKLCQRVSSRVRTFLRDQLRDIKTATRMEFDSRTPPPPYGHVDFVLAQAVREQVINQHEAFLIGSIRIDEVAVRRIADDQKISIIDLKLKFKVAEHRLVQWILKK